MKVNEIICGDTEPTLKRFADGWVDIVITSPPYWNQKSYSFWPKYSQYLESVGFWLLQIYRVLSPGRHCFWVIPDKLPWPPRENGTKERKYLPVYADTERIAAKIGFSCEYPIIWKKPHGTQKMFGSYPYPPTIIHTPMTERICVWKKPGTYMRRPKEMKDASKITKEQWVEYGQDFWEVRPETRSDHPAPFPEELVRRVLTLWSFKSDLVLDPFVGSGTTAVVAKEMNRDYIGIDYTKEYCDIANERLALVER